MLSGTSSVGTFQVNIFGKSNGSVSEVLNIIVCGGQSVNGSN